ncbi:MAG: NADH-quinone oxidoreductase subunit N [Dehalococcoidia bacterium]|nr:NADH-quinone oxidoreductase subunit N [Dehalococcoidia bacterium]MCA9849131.1 NADH-quinone oxidoreductase subunit N [Dehalococcoidia bacterium]
MSLGENLNHIGPALILYIGAGIVLTADLISGRSAPRWVLTIITLVAGLGWTWGLAMGDTRGDALNGAVRVDEFSLFFAFLLIASTLAVTLASKRWTDSLEQGAEFYALMLISAASMVILAQANDLITIFVALETTSISQFIMAGLARTDRSSEAGLKYLLTGAVAAAVLLYGFAFLFGMAGTTSLPGIAAYLSTSPEAQRLPLLLALVFVVAGFGYKMALAPFHAWVPDVYQGSPTVVGSFLSVASKAAGFAVALRLFYTGLGGGDTFLAEDWAKFVAVLAGLSMVFGNTGAILQTNAKRLLGYSSIAQAGNIAVGFAAVAAGSTIGPSGVLFFLGTYAATNLGAFIAVHAVSERLGSENISDFAGLPKRSPLLAAVLSLCLLSLTGIPPTAGFIAKVYVFNGAIQTGHDWLVILVAVAVLNTAISAFYYLRWLRTMWIDEPEDDSRFEPAPAVRGVLVAAAIGVLFFGLWPAPLIEAARSAAETLL